MNDLSKLEQLVLATLEEAGEENVAALTNTVLKYSRGSPSEIETITGALTHLVEAGLVETARFRNNISRHWMPVTQEESVAAIGTLKSDVRWSPVSRLWEWQQDEPRVQILLTDLGLTTAQEMLRESGWPQDLD